jgi:DNA-3-methyladenine glycosylase
MDGIALMRRRRRRTALRDLARGPGRTAAALGHRQAARRRSPVRTERAVARRCREAERHIAVSRRIGISRAVDWPLRFYERGSRFVSGPALR